MKLGELLVSDHKFTVLQFYYNDKNIVYVKYQFLNIPLHYVLHNMEKFLGLIFFKKTLP